MIKKFAFALSITTFCCDPHSVCANRYPSEDTMMREDRHYMVIKRKREEARKKKLIGQQTKQSLKNRRAKVRALRITDQFSLRMAKRKKMLSVKLNREKLRKENLRIKIKQRAKISLNSRVKRFRNFLLSIENRESKPIVTQKVILQEKKIPALSIKQNIIAFREKEVRPYAVKPIIPSVEDKSNQGALLTVSQSLVVAPQSIIPERVSPLLAVASQELLNFPIKVSEKQEDLAQHISSVLQSPREENGGEDLASEANKVTHVTLTDAPQDLFNSPEGPLGEPQFIPAALYPPIAENEGEVLALETNETFPLTLTQSPQDPLNSPESYLEEQEVLSPQVSAILQLPLEENRSEKLALETNETPSLTLMQVPEEASNSLDDSLKNEVILPQLMSASLQPITKGNLDENLESDIENQITYMVKFQSLFEAVHEISKKTANFMDDYFGFSYNEKKDSLIKLMHKIKQIKRIAFSLKSSPADSGMFTVEDSIIQSVQLESLQNILSTSKAAIKKIKAKLEAVNINTRTSKPSNSLPVTPANSMFGSESTLSEEVSKSTNPSFDNSPRGKQNENAIEGDLSSNTVIRSMPSIPGAYLQRTIFKIPPIHSTPLSHLGEAVNDNAKISSVIGIPALLSTTNEDNLEERKATESGDFQPTLLSVKVQQVEPNFNVGTTSLNKLKESLSSLNLSSYMNGPDFKGIENILNQLNDKIVKEKNKLTAGELSSYDEGNIKTIEKELNYLKHYLSNLYSFISFGRNMNLDLPNIEDFMKELTDEINALVNSNEKL